MTVIDREHYKRVTEIISPFTGIDKVDPVILQRAAERGTLVHQICGGIVQGLGEPEMTEEIKGYVDSFKLWWREGKKVLFHEERLYCDMFKITGQIDLLIEQEGQIILVDLKTSACPQKSWPIQLAGYEFLLRADREINIAGRMVVRLKKDGKFPCINKYAEGDDDVEKFISCLTVYNYFYKSGKEEIDLEKL